MLGAGQLMKIKTKTQLKGLCTLSYTRGCGFNIASTLSLTPFMVN